MKNFVVGLIVGLLLGGGLAWASGTFTWVFPDGNVAGTIANPIHIATN